MSITDHRARGPRHTTGPGHRGPAPGGVRWGRVGVAVAVVVAVIVGLVVAVRALVGSDAAPIVAQCTVTTQAGTFNLSPDQAENASTIAAVGHALGLPDHAVTIALATALQESRLIDLDGGDRDSVGLFQQRPSEGWGSPAELIQPIYAATAFYQALEKVPGWDTLQVTVAAQDVQHSADPTAYAYQAPEARSLAIALTGEVPAAFACQEEPTAVASGWQADLQAELGALTPTTASSTGTPVDATDGWVLASWLVGHAARYGFRSVSFAGRTWTPTKGIWKVGGPTDGRVHLT